MTQLLGFGLGRLSVFSSLLAAAILLPLQTFAANPPCMAGPTALPLDNSQVLYYKRTTPNQFLARGYISGTLTRVFPPQNGHDHFEILLTPNKGDTIEVVYNKSFGPLPQLKPGMQVVACGDYITSNAPAGPYQASPSGAIIHWVHRTDNPKKHDGGFLVIDGGLFGN